MTHRLAVPLLWAVLLCATAAGCENTERGRAQQDAVVPARALLEPVADSRCLDTQSKAVNSLLQRSVPGYGKRWACSRSSSRALTCKHRPACSMGQQASHLCRAWVEQELHRNSKQRGMRGMCSCSRRGTALSWAGVGQSHARFTLSSLQLPGMLANSQQHPSELHQPCQGEQRTQLKQPLLAGIPCWCF